MPANPDLTRLALRTLEDALAQANHGPVRRTWGHRLALAWMCQAGVARPWQCAEFWRKLADPFENAPSPVYARDMRSGSLISFLDNWHLAIGAGIPDCVQRAKWAKAYAPAGDQKRREI